MIQLNLFIYIITTSKIIDVAFRIMVIIFKIYIKKYNYYYYFLNNKFFIYNIFNYLLYSFYFISIIIIYG